MFEEFAKAFRLAKNSIADFESNYGSKISDSSRYEVYMLGMMVGFLNLLERGKIPRSNESVDMLISTCILGAKEMGVSSTQLVPLIRSRISGLKADLVGLATSNYPETKQFIPFYTYNAIVFEPLIINQDLSWTKLSEIDDYEKMEEASFFLSVYVSHVNLINRSLL